MLYQNPSSETCVESAHVPKEMSMCWNGDGSRSIRLPVFESKTSTCSDATDVTADLSMMSSLQGSVEPDDEGSSPVSSRRRARSSRRKTNSLRKSDSMLRGSLNAIEFFGVDRVFHSFDATDDDMILTPIKGKEDTATKKLDAVETSSEAATKECLVVFESKNMPGSDGTDVTADLSMTSSLQGSIQAPAETRDESNMEANSIFRARPSRRKTSSLRKQSDSMLRGSKNAIDFFGADRVFKSFDALGDDMPLVQTPDVVGGASGVVEFLGSSNKVSVPVVAASNAESTQDVVLSVVSSGRRARPSRRKTNSLRKSESMAKGSKDAVDFFGAKRVHKSFDALDDDMMFMQVESKRLENVETPQVIGSASDRAATVAFMSKNTSDYENDVDATHPKTPSKVPKPNAESHKKVTTGRRARSSKRNQGSPLRKSESMLGGSMDALDFFGAERVYKSFDAMDDDRVSTPYEAEKDNETAKLNVAKVPTHRHQFRFPLNIKKLKNHLHLSPKKN